MPAKTHKDLAKVDLTKDRSARSKSNTKSKKIVEVKQKAPVESRTTRSKPPQQSKARRSKSVVLAAASESEESEDGPRESEVVFKPGQFVAFISKSAVQTGDQHMTIGKIVENTTATSKEINVVAYTGTTKQAFTCHSKEPITIKDYQVVCSVDIANETAQKVTITKKAATEIAKLVDNIFDSVRDKINQESDEEAEKEDQSESEQESVEAKPRKYVRAIRGQPPQTQVAKQSKKIEKKDESDNEEPKIDPKLKLGKKRAFPDHLNTASSQPNRKMKKLTAEGDSVSVAVQGVKKKVAKAQVLKIGKWNPDTVLVGAHEEAERFGSNDAVINKCCLRCNCRNLVRAVETNNQKLFKACLQAKDTIPDVGLPWSLDTPLQTPLELILAKGHLALFEIFYKVPNTKPTDGEHEYQRAAHAYLKNDRAVMREPLLTRVDTGKVSYKAYGTAVRAVQMTRGNRQGNQAFVQPTNSNVDPVHEFMQNENLRKYITPKFFQAYALITHSSYNPINFFQQFALSGNLQMLEWIIESHIKNENYGFNKLHLDVLKLAKLTDKYHTASITKKAANTSITPLHLACLNPNKAVLQALLDQNNEINVLDTQNNKPIHYAAISSQPGAITLLLEKGASVYDVNTSKKTPLHFAALNSRPENVKAILESNVLAYKYRDKTNKTAFCYALEIGDIETIKAFIQYSQGKIKVNTGQGLDRMTPLMYAAATGNYELAEYLLENKGRVLSKDKYKRTPLIMAVRNGHTRLASLLLQHGSDWKHLDSSSNTPLHYAAASGFIECIDLLLKHGAELNAMNSWKVTPITIAMLNNHQGTVKRLLQEPNVDVNGKDDQGRTLLSMAMLNLEEPQVLEFAAFLIAKGADVNLGDVNKRTPLHILAAYKVNVSNTWIDNKQRLAQIKALKKTLNEMIDLLLEKGGNLALKTEDGQTPFEVALDCDNIDVLNKFSKSVKITESPQILHKFKTKIFDQRFRSIFIQLIEQEKDMTPEVMNHLDDIGMSPFLQYVNQFVEYIKSGEFASRIRQLLIWNSYKHNLNVSKYVVTNELLYDTSSIEDELQLARNRYQASHDQLETSIKSYTFTLFTQPFIELLKFMISKGADPKMKVGKTKFYRELDEHKRHLALVGESRDMINAVNMQINTVQKKEDVKTRKEVIAEQSLNKRGKKGSKIDSLLKDFYAKNKHSAQYMKVNGKTVEIEYNKEFGLQNAIHLLFKHPSHALFDFFADTLHIPIDETDYMGRNPFMINTAAFPSRIEFFKTMETLLKRNIRFDLPDQNGRTPFLIYYEHQNFKLANKLLDLGANIKQMDIGGLFAAKYALIRRQDEELRRLISLGADINQIDNKGRNLLHHAVNMSSATADATFETEQCLIDLGVNINLRDHQGRVPLHYAFVKINQPFDSHQLDPIETVSSLCGQPGLEIEVADRWLKTPLHYAAQRGAAICTLYMIQRGAALESRDIYNNTALGISLLRKHFNYAILLIQKNANVCLPIFDEYPNRIAKQWEDEAKARKRAENVEMESVEEELEEMQVDTGKNLFKQKVKKSVWAQYGSEDEEEDEEESEDESAHEQNVFNNQNAFGMQMFQSRGRKVAKRARYAGGFGLFGQPAQIAKTEPQKKEVEKELPPRSAFRISILNQQQGIAYLILDNKYDYMLAMQDALDEKKFNLVLTLLSKTADNKVVQRKNDLNQNLMHILAKNSSGGLMHTLKRIYDQLKKRGVNCLDQDSLGNNALHYAVDCNCYDLCHILIQEKIDINAVNHAGFTPLTILMKGERGASMLLRDLGLEKCNPLFSLLATSGADVNVKYPEESYGEKNYRCTIMINIVRKCAVEIDKLRNNLHTLMSFNGSLETVDSKGRDVMMHSIMQNNIELVKFFISNSTSSFFREHKDLEGKNAIHYIVNPHDFGSFENVKILEALHKSNLGYNLMLRDNLGMTPFDYAQKQKSGVLANELTKIGGASTQPTSKVSKIDSLKTYLPIEHWPQQQFNFEQDSHDLLAQAEAQRVKELMEEKKDTYVPLDVGFNGEKQYKVYFEGEGENRKAYDAYMTKVDLKNGYYGDYTFYKMQMVYDSNRELYIVLTRYGRIGEEGMNQRTPFISVDDAKKEFHTIFKQKSANEWDSANFVKAPKKYVLVKVNYSNVQHKDYLAPFDYDNCPKTRMDKILRNLIEEISNVTMYQRSMSSLGIDQSQLPVSSLTKETLNTAKEHLNKLGQMIKKLQEIRKSQFGKSRMDGDLEEDFVIVAQIHQELSDLTSAFYQTIPMKETDYWAARPIREPHELQALYTKMESLTQIEFSCRMLLGALYKQKQVNPADYIYDCIQTEFRIMHQGEPEFELIKQFIVNTSQGQMNERKFTLFKVSRKGEGERYEQFQKLKNRRLLFHGTAMTNMLGILSQGLRIAPPEAPTTGYMFGKGLYFADLFRKSANYSHGGHQTQIMLLCEVALGNYLELYKQTYIESLPDGFNSVKAIGQFGGNYPNKTIVTPEGFQVPLGGEIKSQEPTEQQFNKTLKYDKDYDPKANHWGYNQYFNSYAKRFNWPLQMNEYIVYNVNQVKVRYLIQWQ